MKTKECVRKILEILPELDTPELRKELQRLQRLEEKHYQFAYGSGAGEFKGSFIADFENRLISPEKFPRYFELINLYFFTGK